MVKKEWKDNGRKIMKWGQSVLYVERQALKPCMIIQRGQEMWQTF